MNPTSNSSSYNAKKSSSADLVGVETLCTVVNNNAGSDGEISNHLNSLQYDNIIDDSESDISHESVAEKKIIKIDRKLQKYKAMDKVQKRRLQNRKSALKCRIRKTHTISSLTKEVGHLKQERFSLYEEVFILTS